MRGLPEFNFPEFFKAEEYLKDLYIVISPARHDQKAFGFDPIGMTGFEDDCGFQYKECIRWDLDQICDCDAIYMLKGWENSTGAKLEHALAVSLKLQILYQ